MRLWSLWLMFRDSIFIMLRFTISSHLIECFRDLVMVLGTEFNAEIIKDIFLHVVFSSQSLLKQATLFEILAVKEIKIIFAVRWSKFLFLDFFFLLNCSSLNLFNGLLLLLCLLFFLINPIKVLLHFIKINWGLPLAHLIGLFHSFSIRYLRLPLSFRCLLFKASLFSKLFLLFKAFLLFLEIE